MVCPADHKRRARDVARCCSDQQPLAMVAGSRSFATKQTAHDCHVACMNTLFLADVCRGMKVREWAAARCSAA
jgi:hypothetical protein